MTARLRSAYAISGAVLAAAVLTGCAGDGQDAALDGSPPSLAATPPAPATSEPVSSEPASAEPAPAGPVSSQPATGSGTAGGPATPPPVIAYAGGESPGVEVHQPADVSLLHGAPGSFKTFVAGIVRKLTSITTATCDSAAVGVIVEAVRPDGYATGGVNDCGGYHALWAKVDGQWKEIAGTQDIWECTVLERYRVPSDIAGDTCYDPDAKKVRDYQQA